MFNFTVDNRSQFWGQDNRREIKGIEKLAGPCIARKHVKTLPI
jgi:hypothetical protein